MVIGGYMIIFLIGSVLGSFYNVVGYRVPVNQSITKPRSSCRSCGHVLHVYDLLPIFSYVILKGKCRSCKERITPMYPVIELLTGLLFLLPVLLLNQPMTIIIAWLLTSLLMIVLVSDLTYMLIPDKVLKFFFVVFLTLRIIQPLTPWWDVLLGGAIGFLLPLILAVISRGGLGGGDIKLFALIGFLIGTKGVLFVMILSTLFGALFGLVALLLGLLDRKKPIPFGPFIVLGTLSAYYYGDRLIQFYFHVLLS